MRPLLIAVSLVLCTGLSGAAPLSDATAAAVDARGKTRRDFQNLWQERLTSYRGKQEHLAAEHKRASDAILASDFLFAASDKRLEVFTVAVLADAEINGRGMLLTDFLMHTERKPSVGLTRAWLQGQFDVVRGAQAEAESLARHTFGLMDQPNTRVIDFLSAWEKAVMKRGEAIGRAEELVLLSDNFSAYAEEFSQADARDQDRRRRFAAALAGMAASLRANQGWTAQCRALGHTMTCSGR